jgi:hypothetical protein
MTSRSVALQAGAAGVGLFLVDVWPAVIIWRAGASGSVGDLREVHFVGLGLAVSVAVAVAGGWAMSRALDTAQRTPGLAPLDPWGAWALGVGVYSVALIVVPAVVFAVVLAEENDALADRTALIDLLWVGGHALAAVPAFLAAWALLVWRRSPRR